MAAVDSWTDILYGTAARAGRSFALTLAAMGLLAGGLAIAGYQITAQGRPFLDGRGALVALLALPLTLVLGSMLATKRAVLSALGHGVDQLDLAPRVVQALFDRVGRLGGVADLSQRVPLAQAEERLSAALRQLLRGDEAGAGFLRRRVQGWLLEQLQEMTLARFRADAAQGGGVDLAKVRDELSEKARPLLLQRFEETKLRVTVLFAGAPVLVALLLAFLLRRS